MSAASGDVEKWLQKSDGSFVRVGVVKPDGTFVPDERVSSLMWSNAKFPRGGRLTDAKGDDGSLENPLLLPVRFKRAREEHLEQDERVRAPLESVKRPGKVRCLQGGVRLALFDELDEGTEALFIRWMMNEVYTIDRW